ncbi:hypothetical protein OH77DRAFT_1022863 [Trametes cingulata]|nr:hypothetical protein OH77DRAFT_1022863 [Trametes cingulata]
MPSHCGPPPPIALARCPPRMRRWIHPTPSSRRPQKLPWPLRTLLQALLRRSAVGLSLADTPPRLCTVPCSSHILHPSWTLFRVGAHAHTTHAKRSIPGRALGETSLLWLAAPLARTLSLAGDLAWWLCWMYRSCGNTKPSCARNATRRPS